jgi:hypothetical protein
MRKVAIIGGRQSGLQLALGLLQNKYEVTLVSNRTPEQILCGRVTSSQFMFHNSLQNERDLVINFWEKKCPIIEGIAFTIPGPGKTKALFWEAKLDHYGQSVDQRVKFAGWMKEFAKRGGNLVIQDAGPREIDGYGKSYDLVLVAAGKGEINRIRQSNPPSGLGVFLMHCRHDGNRRGWRSEAAKPPRDQATGEGIRNQWAAAERILSEA